ncbi:hypothetical protein GCM10027289_21130 [Tsukamurella serpentis]
MSATDYIATTARKVVAAMAPGTTGSEVTAASLGAQDRLREDLGFDSVRLIELTVALEQVFDLPPFPSERLAAVLRVGDVVDLVVGAVAAP